MDDSMDDSKNCRGITLLSCLGKLFSALLNNRLSKYVEKYGKIRQEQAGFRQGYITVDHLYTLHTLLEIYLGKVNECIVWSKESFIGD